MKKIYNTLVMMAIVAMTATFTSCDEDIAIANSLEGTWSGTMYVYTSYNGHDYYATSTDIEFIGDPLRWTRGTGYWVDHYSNAPWDYVANHIEWKVNNRNIDIYFVEEDTWMTISDYRLSDNYFTGYIYDGSNDVEFRLRHIDSPNWSSYRYGYDYYWSRETRGIDNDSTVVEKPVRKFGVKPE